MATVALRNAELVNEGRRLRADVLLRDGLIERIGTIPAGPHVDREIDLQLAQLQWAPRVNISALTGRAVQKLVPAMETALASWDARISTGQLNAWIKEVVAATPPPVRGGKQPRILFATQATNRPPTFVLFTSGFLEAGYRRFLERRVRETFGFEGSPIRINVRVREKRAPRKR